jgi:protein-tyrosine phosphatase
MSVRTLLSTAAKPGAGLRTRIPPWAAAGPRFLKRLPDRILHPLRRLLARRRLGRPIDSVLFLCLGNICRSPYAAEAFRRAGPAGIAVDSAGLIGPGRSSPEAAVSAAGRRGIELTAHRSKLLTGDLASRAALVVVMAPGQKRAVRRLGVPGRRILVLGDLDPDPISTRTIPDPYDREPAVFDACYERIDRCLGELASELAPAGRPTAQPEPGRRGASDNLGQIGS